jgi:hypothetical protein
MSAFTNTPTTRSVDQQNSFTGGRNEGVSGASFGWRKHKMNIGVIILPLRIISFVES